MAVPAHFRIPAYFLISLLAYSVLGYAIERHEFTWLIATFGILFTTYFLMLREAGSWKVNLKWGIMAAILFRLVLLLSVPNLSDDFFRFIWDGNLFTNGINPFIYTPAELVRSGEVPFLSENLYAGINSAEYYSVYPPLCQFIFAFSTWFFGEQLLGNIVAMRLVILGAEIGTFYVLKKLLDYFSLNPAYLLVYALNPLIILELSGNLHFEGVMIFFLLLSFYLLLKNKYLWGAVFFALAVNTKLIPLLLGPYLVFSLGWKRSAYFIAISGMVTLLLHLPFLDLSFIEHFSSSIGLYFKTFEFNASIYYLVRWVGFQVKGYNIIETAGPVLAVITTCLITGISWWFRDKKLENLPMMYITVTAIYYLLSTTVHPWYVSSLLAFVPLTGLLFPLAWSLAIPLTYIAYISSTYSENLWLVALEYTILILVLGYDFYRRQDPIPQKMKWIFNFAGKT